MTETNSNTQWQAMKAREERGAGGLRLGAVLERAGHDYAIIQAAGTTSVSRETAYHFWRLAQLQGALVRGSADSMFQPGARWCKLKVYVPRREHDIEVLSVAEMEVA